MESLKNHREHVDNKAFTNYMAWWNIGKTMEYTVQFKAEKPELYTRLDAKLGPEECYAQWDEKRGKILLPQPTQNGVQLRDATCLTLKDIRRQR